MPAAHPKFRDDLVISQLDDRQEAAFVVKDPVTKRFFRLKQHEIFIAQQLDGSTSLEEIQHRFEQKFDISLPKDKLDRFIRRLQDLSFLESSRSDRELSRAQRNALSRQSPLQRLLYIRLRTLNPNRLFDALLPRIGFFFTRQFVLFVIGLTAVALYITISNWAEYTAQAKSLIVAGTIPTLLLVVLLVTVLHEFAHGLTCKYYGGNVHGIGFLLIYFLPAFYCDVSDAWLFKEKSKRLWVSFAGIFFQIFLWGLATIMWRILDTETWLSKATCLMMATSGISTIFNLNPLLKLDGYYLIVDYFKIPNLRKRAFEYLGSTIKGGLGVKRTESYGATAKEKRIYLFYGILAGLYSAGLLLFILWKVAGYVFSRLQGTGLVLLTVVCLLLFTGILEKWIVTIYNMATQGKGIDVRRKRTMIVLTAIALFFIIAIFGKWELKISNKAELLPSSRASIRADVAGTIREILVEEGDVVTSNQVIARLDDMEYRAEKLKTEAEIAKWQAELDLLQKGPLDEEIEQLQKLVEKARMKVTFAEREFNRISELFAKNLIASTEYEKAKEELSLRRKELEQAESDLEVLYAGYRTEKIKAAQAEVERLRSSLAYLEEQIARTAITSPIPGVVSTRHLSDKLKEYVEVGDEICMVVDYRILSLEIPVSEKDVSHVRIGQRVKFRARAMPGIAFHGKVTAVAPVAVSNSARKVFISTSEVDNPDLLLHPGMTGNAKIYCGKKRFIYLWTRKIIQFIRVEFWW
jgi:putative peptide zinc metalloprotease protein